VIQEDINEAGRSSLTDNRTSSDMYVGPVFELSKRAWVSGDIEAKGTGVRTASQAGPDFAGGCPGPTL